MHLPHFVISVSSYISDKDSSHLKTPAPTFGEVMGSEPPNLEILLNFLVKHGESLDAYIFAVATCCRTTTESKHKDDDPQETRKFSITDLPFLAVADGIEVLQKTRCGISLG